MFHLLLFPIKFFWYGLVLLLSMLAAWLVSSLAVHINGPVWLPWLVGGLILPIMPVYWTLESLIQEIRAEDKLSPEQREQLAEKKEVGFMPRVALNTFTLSLTVLATLLGLFPQESFTALTTRGDWMFAQRQEAWAPNARIKSLYLASRLEGVYQRVLDNPSQAWAEALDSVRSSPQPQTRPVSAASGKTQRPDWPPSREIHPAIARLPANMDKNLSTVAHYIAQQESNPYGRVKAIYDYVATRIAYDAPALAMGQYPPQDAQTVFKTRKAVCAGYSRLFMALAHEMGILAVYVTGDARDLQGMTAPGTGHAWNAVQIEGNWYLLDTTWGSGLVGDGGFVRRYNPDYLFTPPEVFGVDHFPTESKWQLNKKPISRETFERQPLLRASFFERGYRLEKGLSSPIKATEYAKFRLENSKRQYLLGHLTPDVRSPKGKEKSSDKTEPVHCQVTGTRDLSVSCKIPKPGAYKLELFSNQHASGNYEFIGQLKVQAD